ncbi:MAG: pyruvate ferredoxin oxidoreductase [Peptococcaceae bacterium]|jgi:pyruvate ferredoxin oxidoreductase alpha subunit/2-oxoisovalerate ferredoxin oxidoreductase alpha subunit|nr:pyruvate ferredoxin oxidoreductase [Peptococcaceae bacterium]
MSKILNTGNGACAMAVKAAKVDIIAAYPITPQTSIAEKLAAYVAQGEMDAKYLPVESEHSVMSASAAASAAGARTFTATSSQGLLYMHEVLHYTAGGRLPLVIANVNRAICAPWCLYVDHQDAVSQRDTGWIQFFVSTIQEIYDTILLAYKVTEQIEIPVMVNYDGFLLSHSMMPFEPADQALVDAFLPAYEPNWRLHPQWGGTFGNVAPADEYTAHRRRLAEDLEKAKELIESEARNFQDLIGRWHGGLLDWQGPGDAEVLLVSMGSMASEVQLAVQLLERHGIRAAGLRIRVFRPFPREALARIIPAGAKVLVFDRNHAYGTGGGALLSEIKAALYDRRDNIQITGRVMGVGGEDLPASLLASQALEMWEELNR